MGEPFDNCWERIRRADTHRDAIAALWNAFIEEESYAAHVRVDNDRTGSISIEQIRPLPSTIALELGEFLYQLRATLDACIYELASVNTRQRPPADEEKLEFPICSDRIGFKKSHRKIAPLTENQRQLVEAVQPYSGRERGLSPEDLASDIGYAFGILNDWARKDRHRKLHIIASLASEIRPMLRLPVGASVREIRVLHDTFILKDEREIATFTVEGYRPGMRIQANPNLMLDLGVDEVPSPCHDVDTLPHRMEIMEIGAWAIVGAMMKTVGIDPPNDIQITGRSLSF